MKKFIYIASIILYVLISIYGSHAHHYLEVSPEFLKRSIGLLLLVSLVISSIVIYFYAKIFPKDYGKQNRTRKVLMSIATLIITMAVTISMFKFVNAHIGKQVRVELHGFITNKYRKTTSKGYKTYYVDIKDSVGKWYYKFEVSRPAYILATYGPVQKRFYRGCFGLLYSDSY